MTTVIHHSADYDGIFCREIARKFLPDAELIGWDFVDPPLAIPDGQIYILDLPVDRVFGFDYAALKRDQPKDVPFKWPKHPAGLVWIDHHKSSIDSHPTDIPGYRIDGVAACRLAWQWFTVEAMHRDAIKFLKMPAKQDFIDRKVCEPQAVRLAGEYDIWDKRDPDAELFQHGLRSRELTPHDWNILLGNFRKPSIREIEQMMDAGHPFDLRPDGTMDESVGMVRGLLDGGKILQYAKTQENASTIRHLGFDLEWEGLKFLACNHARYNSHLFTAGLRPDHDACFGFKFSKGRWEVSLYHAPGKEHHDLSLIAVKHGGGGHRGACGFQTDKLPFL